MEIAALEDGDEKRRRRECCLFSLTILIVRKDMKRGDEFKEKEEC